MFEIEYHTYMKRCLLCLGVLVAAMILLVVAVDRDPDTGAPSYDEALAATASDRMEPMPRGGDEEAAAMARLSALWANLSEENVRQSLASVYAEDVWFYDTVKTIQGLGNLAHYMQETAARVHSCRVEFLDTMTTDEGYFIRWRMVIVPTAADLHNPWISYGITHFRFNRDGRVVLHRDYWDPAAGIYEKLPGVGWILRNIRARL